MGDRLTLAHANSSPPALHILPPLVFLSHLTHASASPGHPSVWHAFTSTFPRQSRRSRMARLSFMIRSVTSSVSEVGVLLSERSRSSMSSISVPARGLSRTSIGSGEKDEVCDADRRTDMMAEKA